MKRNLTEKYKNGQGRFENLVKLTDLNDGTCLIYETSEIYLLRKVMRVSQVSKENGEEVYTDYVNAFDPKIKDKSLMNLLNKRFKHL